MLLLWLQVMSPFRFSCVVGFCYRALTGVFFFFNIALSLPFVIKGWTAWSCLHAPVTWIEPALPAVTEPGVRVSHRTWETECTRYSDQRIHQTPSVLRAGATIYPETKHKFRAWCCIVFLYKLSSKGKILIFVHPVRPLYPQMTPACSLKLIMWVSELLT